MQTFDVYLKKRLTEIDVTISQLVQRDTFTLYNYLYLLCSLSELELIKTIAGYADMELNAEIFDLEEEVHELLDSKMYLNTMVDLSSQTTACGNAEMILFADAVKAIKKDLISSESVLELSAKKLDYYIAHSFGTVNFDMRLIADRLEFLKRGFEKFESEMCISAESQLSSSKVVELEDLNMMLYTDPIGLFYLASVSGNAEMFLSVSPIDQYILEKILHDLDVITSLSASINTILHLDKYISTENIFQIFAKITEVLIDIIHPYESEIVLLCEASAGAIRYRFLNEMDSSTVSEFDDMTLHELDFITIA